jgi:hypothetical protein
MNPTIAIRAAALFLALLSPAAQATPMVTVISPKPGLSSGSPIFYEAYATNSECAKGIAAIRVYTAPYVAAITVNGAHLENFISLQPGSYSTVVQAWDNCGGVGKTAVNIVVTASPGVTVFLPNGRSVAAPIHFAASAQNSACAAGINAIRIYVAPHTSPYTIYSNRLNAYINLPPGIRTLTVQAWDKCGQVFKTNLSSTVTTTADANLYAVNLNDTAPTIYQFKVASDGILKNPNGAGNLPEAAAGPGADNLAVDPGGWFLYASTASGIYGFQINPATGRLTPMPGSPFPLNDKNNAVPPLIRVDPSGNFLFARYGGAEVGDGTTYRINRSTGALTSTGYVIPTVWYTHTFDASGQYLYFINYGGIDAYRFNPNNGSMVPLMGSTFFFDSLNSMYLPSMAAEGNSLYVGGNGVSGGNGGGVWEFKIDYATGIPTEMTGSPFLPASTSQMVLSILPDTRSRFLWSLQSGQSSYGIESFQVQNGGALTPSMWFTDLMPYSLGDSTDDGPKFAFTSWAEDHSGKFVFTSYTGDAPNRGIASWPISAAGDLQTQTVFLTLNPIGAIAVARQNPR